MQGRRPEAGAESRDQIKSDFFFGTIEESRLCTGAHEKPLKRFKQAKNPVKNKTYSVPRVEDECQAWELMHSFRVMLPLLHFTNVEKSYDSLKGTEFLSIFKSTM